MFDRRPRLTYFSLHAAPMATVPTAIVEGLLPQPLESGAVTMESVTHALEADTPSVVSRVERLRAKLFQMDDRALFLERMPIIAECAARYAGETEGRHFALTLRELLARISIVIDEDDLLVGRVPEALPTPEQEAWYEANRAAYLRPTWFQSNGHLTLAWERLLAEGLAGIRRRAEAHLGRLEGDDPAALSKCDFLQGAVIACDAITAYANRYAEEAERLAREAPTPERREELLEIA
ncbi:MAG: hypothetical protein JXA74_04270, partial [Anaerolineae bacterium]|nr:hypothetical protein [Anaerolineae bacterium]